MAAELGGKGIRVHALSPGAMATRAASGIDRFDELLARTAERAPTHTSSPSRISDRAPLSWPVMPRGS